MANEICLSGFGGAEWEGNYTISSMDYWSNSSGTYWVFRDANYWYISSSPYFFYYPYVKARKAFSASSPGVWGNYTGVDGNPDGLVEWGVC